MRVPDRAEETKTGRMPGPLPDDVPAANQPPIENIQLAQFLRWLVPLVFGFALLEGATFLALHDVGTGMTGAVLFGHGCLMLAAWTLVRWNRPRDAVILICMAFLGATLIMVPIQPDLIPTLAVSPFLAVAVALPYVSERVLNLLIFAAWVIIVVVAVLGELLTYSSTLPAWYESFFRIASLSTAAAVVLLLLWQFRVRLMSTLEQTRAAEKRLQYEATHDTLTGLPNRTLFIKRLSCAMERATKDRGYAFAVLFLDLDRFKSVNDSLGHRIGDMFLKEIGRRLQAYFHSTDTVARLGGDEFGILLEDIASLRNDAVEVAKRLQDELRTPLKLYGYELFTTASIGIVLEPFGYSEPEELLRDADTAMYRAKESGKACHIVFDVDMRAEAVSLLRLETALRRAIEQREFVIYYQPIVWLASGRVVGFEALVRWEHPERGLVPPSEFVSLAEETGLIVPLGLFVAREACQRAALWRSRFPNQWPLTMSVNLSPLQLLRLDLGDRIAELLEETGLDGRDLCFEITESALMHDEELATATFSRFKDLGIRIHLDDFGTGYSSLAVLHRYPIDALKIDRSFVRAMGTSGEKADMVHAIATLAHQLGMDVIAEGVETTEQLKRLREVGCDYGQGFLFSKPAPSEVIEAMLSAKPDL